MEIKRYAPQCKVEWDYFVRHSKNGTFLFCRNFMDYHQDRFNDYSFLFYNGNKLEGVIAGHIDSETKTYHTHQGLSYGGLLLDSKTTATEVLEVFELLTSTLKLEGIEQIRYKAIPHIYHQSPAEEDLYALFRYKAQLVARSISSAILLPINKSYSNLRTRGIKKANKNKLSVSTSSDLETFWDILCDNLELKYKTKPVHSLVEMSLLKSLFPREIRLFTVSDSDNQMLAGCILFETKTVIHVQYIASSQEGKNKGAIDLLIDYLLHTRFNHQKYFDFGTSTENNGLYLNEKLLFQKEGFGARAIVYDTYCIAL